MSTNLLQWPQQLQRQRLHSLAVEHFLSKEKVHGSNPCGGLGVTTNVFAFFKRDYPVNCS